MIFVGIVQKLCFLSGKLTIQTICLVIKFHFRNSFKSFLCLNRKFNTWSAFKVFLCVRMWLFWWIDSTIFIRCFLFALINACNHSIDLHIFTDSCKQNQLMFRWILLLVDWSHLIQCMSQFEKHHWNEKTTRHNYRLAYST